MRPIFNKKITEKCNLWDREQCTDALFIVDKVNYCGLNQKKKKKEEKNTAPKRRRKNNFHPNGHILTRNNDRVQFPLPSNVGNYFPHPVYYILSHLFS